MNNNKSRLILVVDISGSMGYLAPKASEGINKLIEEQKSVEGYCTLDLYEFNTEVKHLYSGDIRKFKGPYSLHASGGTAMWDGLGKAITDVSAKIKKTRKASRPGVTLLTLVTDGEENSSREYTSDQVAAIRDGRKLIAPVIESARAQGWDLTFLCNNPLVQRSGQSIGINQSIQYDTNAIQQVYTATSSKFARMRGQSMSGQQVQNLYSANEIAMMSGK